MSATYRGAYLENAEHTALTSRDQASLSDADLIAAALAEARAMDIIDEEEDDPDEAYPRLTLAQVREQITIGAVHE